jgi:hypothetical protein
MDRSEAERALLIIREVIQNTRDDLTAHNWGLIWIVHSFTNSIGSAFGALIDQRALPVYWYLLPLGILAAVNLVVVRLLMVRDQGVRSYVEWQVHGIWTTFVVFSLAAVAVLELAGAKPTLYGPVFAMGCGVSFALMGVVFHKRFFAIAVMFMAVMLVAAAWQPIQWYVIGAAWFVAMFVPGVIMHREKLRRQKHDGQTRIV